MKGLGDGGNFIWMSLHFHFSKKYRKYSLYLNLSRMMRLE